MSLAPGTEIGPYEVLSQLGAGGMGEVYRAQDQRLARVVALKLIRRSMVPDEAAIDGLLREATLASALNHPNIVTIYETGVAGGDRYVAMELVEGDTLRTLASRGLPVSRVLSIGRQIAEALAVAHAAQIVHRDIKPENVMVRPDGYAKLLDFGLARLQPDALAAGHTTAATEAGVILGTIGYMAPEQARGDKVGAEADIFALGVLLYELVTGRHPFMAASQLGTLHALMWETPEPPSLLNTELPRAIDQLILEAIQKDPRLRPGAMDVMYRLTLAHDSSVAAALSEVTVSPPSAAAVRHIVGRDAELTALVEELETVRAGRTRLAFIAGEAGMLIRLHRYAEAYRALDEAASISAATGQPAYESERARLQGTLFARQPSHHLQADESFRQALSIARAQGARWLEPRSARAYADFLVNRGRAGEARDLLRPTLAWFSEGRTTIDYVYAETLLKSLEGG